MDKYIYNEKNGLWHELQGDYYLPCLKLPEERTAYIGILGQRHLRYLKQYHRVRYYILLTSGKLNSYLADIDRQAEEMFPRLGKRTRRKGRRNGSAQSGKPNAVGTEDEQSAKRRYGNRIKRAYLSLKLHKKGRRQQTAAFLILGVI